MVMMAPARMRSRPCSGRSFKLSASPARMKENSPICASEVAMISAVARRVAEQADDEIGGDRLGDQDDEHGGQQRQRRLQHDARIEQHADRDEEQHGEGVAQRQRLGGGLLAQAATRSSIMPAKKAPSASEMPNSSAAT